MEKSLRSRVEVLLKQKKDRKQELKALQEQDRDLCDILCTAPLCLDSNAVPSLEDLDRYRCHLASLSAEKEQRREEFVSRKRQIILLMEELDHTPETSFERDVVCEDEECFCLSTDNIAALQTLLQQVRRHTGAAPLAAGLSVAPGSSWHGGTRTSFRELLEDERAWGLLGAVEPACALRGRADPMLSLL
ncbi:protein regulator of cytokinesis 1-like [Podargus strigoides]